MKKYLIYAMSLLLAGSVFSSCTNEEDDIFEASPADRLNQAQEEYTKLLCKPANGWAMQYFADNDNEGGYTFLMKFRDNTSVTIAGNNQWIGNTYKEETSMYELISDNGPVLTFNTFNDVFHIFSTPEDLPSTSDNEAGYGHRGDYEFIVMDATDELITLKGKKTGIRVLMTPLAEDADWETYLRELKAKGSQMFNSKIEPLILDVDGERYTITNATSGVLSLVPEGGDAITETQLAPYLVNEFGIRLAKPFTGKDENFSIQSFTTGENGILISNENGHNAIIKARPLAQLFNGQVARWIILPGELDANGNYPNLGGKFNELYKVVVADTKTAIKSDFREMGFQYDGINDKYAIFSHNGKARSLNYITENIVDDNTVKLADLGEGDRNADNDKKRIPAIYEMVKFIASGEYTLSSENALTPAVMKLTSKSDANNCCIIEVQ